MSICSNAWACRSDRFFALWKDADPDIPILKQAKAEYERYSETSEPIFVVVRAEVSLEVVN